MEAAFRDSTESARCRRDALLENRAQRPDLELAVWVYRRRVARIFAGVGMIVSGVAFLVTSVLGLVASRTSIVQGRLLLVLLGASWMLSVILYFAGGALGALARWPHRRVEALPTRDPVADLEALETQPPAEAASARADRLEPWSIGLPLAGITLLLPLTIHLAVILIAYAGESPAAFGTWSTLSSAIVGHAHVAAAICGVIFSFWLHKQSTDRPGNRGWSWGFIATGVGAVTAAFPGVVLLGIPPVLAAVTGIVFLPVSFAFAYRRVRIERGLLVSATVPS